MPSSRRSISLPVVGCPGLIGSDRAAVGTNAEHLRRRAAVGGFSGLTWFAFLLTFLGAAGRDGGFKQRRSMQQGQGLARCHRGERRQRRPTPDWTHQLTSLVMRDLFINKSFSIYW